MSLLRLVVCLESESGKQQDDKRNLNLQAPVDKWRNRISNLRIVSHCMTPHTGTAVMHWNFSHQLTVRKQAREDQANFVRGLRKQGKERSKSSKERNDGAVAGHLHKFGIVYRAAMVEHHRCGADQLLQALSQALSRLLSFRELYFGLNLYAAIISLPVLPTLCLQQHGL